MNTKKLIILAPSAGGKSTLMRYFRIHTDIDIVETDEAVTKANNNVWPDDDLKNKFLVPLTTNEIISRPNVIYFASYIPDDLILLAKDRNFKIILLELSAKELSRRNEKRMLEEHYPDASPWFKLQINTFKRLKKIGIIDEVIDGDQSVKALFKQIISLY